ncbi:MAG: Gfo/Idh/MocA family oxidoreductase, partial [Verrucomicrobiales bacterium]|nr:Gfo/Idh/MocA family oxidoreductase [Verrucomicrobiales bacterium]
MKLLIIGTGSIGERHLRCFQQLGRCQAIAICESHDARRADVATRYGVPSSLAFSDLESALASGPFDAAVIATPAPTHIPMATRLAQLGIHLLIEKPLSLATDGIEDLIEIIHEKSLTVAVGYVHRAHPAVAAMKEALDSGKFGRILQIRTASGQAFATLRPAYREVYFAKPELGGGAINDMITHFYNVGDWLAGPIRKVMTDADHQILEGVTVEDTVHTLVRQGSNGEVMGSYALNLYQHPNEVLITVVAEHGTLQAEYAKKRWSWMMEPSGVWHHEPVEMPEVDVMYRRQNGAFLDAIEGSGDVLCSLEEAFRTLKVNLASHRSRA